LQNIEKKHKKMFYSYDFYRTTGTGVVFRHLDDSRMHRRTTPEHYSYSIILGGSVAEWLACWTQAQKARVQIAAATLSGSSLRQTAHTHRASVHHAAKLAAAILRVAGVTAGLAESNGSLPPCL